MLLDDIPVDNNCRCYIPAPEKGYVCIVWSEYCNEGENSECFCPGVQRSEMEEENESGLVEDVQHGTMLPRYTYNHDDKNGSCVEGVFEHFIICDLENALELSKERDSCGYKGLKYLKTKFLRSGKNFKKDDPPVPNNLIPVTIDGQKAASQPERHVENWHSHQNSIQSSKMEMKELGTDSYSVPLMCLLLIKALLTVIYLIRFLFKTNYHEFLRKKRPDYRTGRKHKLPKISHGSSEPQKEVPRARRRMNNRE